MTSIKQHRNRKHLSPLQESGERDDKQQPDETWVNKNRTKHVYESHKLCQLAFGALELGFASHGSVEIAC